MLVSQYVAAFRHVEAGNPDRARSALEELGASISRRVVPEEQPALNVLVNGQLARLV